MRQTVSNPLYEVQNNQILNSIELIMSNRVSIHDIDGFSLTEKINFVSERTDKINDLLQILDKIIRTDLAYNQSNQSLARSRSETTIQNNIRSSFSSPRSIPRSSQYATLKSYDGESRRSYGPQVYFFDIKKMRDCILSNFKKIIQIQKNTSNKKDEHDKMNDMDHIIFIIFNTQNQIDRLLLQKTVKPSPDSAIITKEPSTQTKNFHHHEDPKLTKVNGESLVKVSESENNDPSLGEVSKSLDEVSELKKSSSLTPRPGSRGRRFHEHSKKIGANSESENNDPSLDEVSELKKNILLPSRPESRGRIPSRPESRGRIPSRPESRRRNFNVSSGNKRDINGGKKSYRNCKRTTQHKYKIIKSYKNAKRVFNNSRHRRSRRNW